MAWSVQRLLAAGIAGTHEVEELLEASHQLPIEP
jgi:hypothetical protein